MSHVAAVSHGKKLSYQVWSLNHQPCHSKNFPGFLAPTGAKGERILDLCVCICLSSTLLIFLSWTFVEGFKEFYMVQGDPKWRSRGTFRGTSRTRTSWRGTLRRGTSREIKNGLKEGLERTQKALWFERGVQQLLTSQCQQPFRYLSQFWNPKFVLNQSSLSLFRVQLYHLPGLNSTESVQTVLIYSK